jgi:hypothetical protein
VVSPTVVVIDGAKVDGVQPHAEGVLVIRLMVADQLLISKLWLCHLHWYNRSLVNSWHDFGRLLATK